MAQNLSGAHWTKQALCKFDKSFMSYHIDDVETCKNTCLQCPVQAECIMDAAIVNGSFIAGGTSKYDRLVLQWKRVSNVDDSNFEGSDRYVSEVLRRVRKAIRSGSKQ